MSTSIESGISSADTITSTAWVTMLTVPPRLIPGADSAFMTCTGIRTRILAPTPSRMKSTWTGRSFTASSWKSRGMTRCVVPSTSSS